MVFNLTKSLWSQWSPHLVLNGLIGAAHLNSVLGILKGAKSMPSAIRLNENSPLLLGAEVSDVESKALTAAVRLWDHLTE